MADKEPHKTDDDNNKIELQSLTSQVQTTKERAETKRIPANDVQSPPDVTVTADGNSEDEKEAETSLNESSKNKDESKRIPAMDVQPPPEVTVTADGNSIPAVDGQPQCDETETADGNSITGNVEDAGLKKSNENTSDSSSLQKQIKELNQKASKPEDKLCKMSAEGQEEREKSVQSIQKQIQEEDHQVCESQDEVYTLSTEMQEERKKCEQSFQQQIQELNQQMCESQHKMCKMSAELQEERKKCEQNEIEKGDGIGSDQTSAKTEENNRIPAKDVQPSPDEIVTPDENREIGTGLNENNENRDDSKSEIERDDGIGPDQTNANTAENKSILSKDGPTHCNEKETSDDESISENVEEVGLKKSNENTCDSSSLQVNVQDLQQQVSESQNKICELSAEVQEEREKSEKRHASKQALRNDNEVLRGKMKEGQDKINSLQKEIQELNQQVSESQEKICMLSAEVQEEQKKCEQRRASEQALQNDNEVLRGKMKEGQDKINSLQKEIQELNQQVSESQEKICKLSAEVQGEQKKCEQRHASEQALQNDNEVLRGKMKEGQDKMNSYQKHIQELNQQVSESQEKICKLSAEVQEEQKKCEQSQASEQALQCDNEVLQGKLKQGQDKIKSLQKHIQELNQQVSVSQDKILKLSAEVQKERKKFEQSHVSEQALQKANEDLKRKRKEGQDKIDSLREEITLRKNIQQDLENIIRKQDEDLLEEQTRSKRAVDDLEETFNREKSKMTKDLLTEKTFCSQINEQNGRLHQSVKSLEDANRKKDREVQQRMKENNSLKKKAVDEHKKFTKLEEEKKNQDRVVKELQTNNMDASRNIDQLSRRIKEFEKKMKQRDGEISQLQYKTQDLQSKLDANLRKVENLEKEKIDLTLRLSKLAGANLTYNNPNIADLSDENRPTKLAEEFSELYDNEWTDAFEIIDIIDETEKIQYMLNILKKANKLCQETTENHINAIKEGFATLFVWDESKEGGIEEVNKQTTGVTRQPAAVDTTSDKDAKTTFDGFEQEEVTQNDKKMTERIESNEHKKYTNIANSKTTKDQQAKEVLCTVEDERDVRSQSGQTENDKNVSTGPEDDTDQTGPYDKEIENKVASLKRDMSVPTKSTLKAIGKAQTKTEENKPTAEGQVKTILQESDPEAKLHSEVIPEHLSTTDQNDKEDMPTVNKSPARLSCDQTNKNGKITSKVMQVTKGVQTASYCTVSADFEQLRNEQKKSILEIRAFFEKQLSTQFEEKCVAIVAGSTHENLQSDDCVMKYIRKCLKVCWSMCRHEPPVYIGFREFEDDSPFDTNVFKPYTKSGRLVDFVVWPPLYLHKGGPLLSKGVAQGRQ